MSKAALPFGLKHESLQQGIKWAVYLLLAFNSIPYLQEDWHAMLNGHPLYAWDEFLWIAGFAAGGLMIARPVA